MKERSQLWIAVMVIFAMDVKLELAGLAFVSTAAMFLCVAVDSAHRMPKPTVRIIMDPIPVSNAIFSTLSANCSLSLTGMFSTLNDPVRACLSLTPTHSVM